MISGSVPLLSSSLLVRTTLVLASSSLFPTLRAAILVLQCEAMLQYACKMDNMQVGGVGWTSQDTNILLVNKFGVGNAPKVRVLVGKFAALGPAGLGQIVPGLAGLSSNGECKWISLLLTMLGVPPRLFQCTDPITAAWPVGV